ncbi:hypothetical protein RvY_14512 [Ramazzottius varieornatus]|uniref:3'-5' exonuclease domain-containing protein n=1 Tax=Ramazzottius varieornatus TaxID=947166 RepID=A0A1D1VRP9_RAMVA|nr:hypothetical protein RvY_14512 [Ramazzottius varieornatus]
MAYPYYTVRMRNSVRPHLIPASESNLNEFKMDAYADADLHFLESATSASEEECGQTLYAKDKVVKYSRQFAFLSSLVPDDLHSPLMKPFAALDFVTDIRDFDLCNSHSDYPQLYLVVDKLKEDTVEKVIRYLQKQKTLSVAFVQSIHEEHDLGPLKSVLAVASSRIVFLFTLQFSTLARRKYLGGMLTDFGVMKVVHNASSFEKDLTDLFGVQLQPFMDVALTQRQILKTDGRMFSLQDLVIYYAKVSPTFRELVRLNFPRLRMVESSSNSVANIQLEVVEKVVFLQAIQKYQLTMLMKETVGETKAVVEGVYESREAAVFAAEERYVHSVPERTSPVRLESAASTDSTASSGEHKEWEDGLEEECFSSGTAIIVG